MRELNDRAGLLQRVADLDRDAAGLRDQVELERRAREQAEAAAVAARRPPEEAKRLLADLDTAAAALRAATTQKESPVDAPSPDAAAAADEARPASAGDARPTGIADASAPSESAGEVTRRIGSEVATAESAGEATRRGGGEVATAESAGEATRRAGSEVATAESAGEATRRAGSDAATAESAGDVAPSAAAGERAAPSHAAGEAEPPADTAGEAVPPATTASDVRPSEPEASTPRPTPAAKPGTALVRADTDRRLRKALVALSREDSTAAGALLVGLLPAQGAVLEGSLSYDLTVRGIGTFAVFVEDGSARVVRLSRKRPRRQALFHLAGDPTTLAELLAGEREGLGRFRRKGRVTGRRRRARELASLPQARLSLAEAVAAGARLEPALVYRALPFAIAAGVDQGPSLHGRAADRRTLAPIVARIRARRTAAPRRRARERGARGRDGHDEPRRLRAAPTRRAAAARRPPRHPRRPRGRRGPQALDGSGPRRVSDEETLRQARRSYSASPQAPWVTAIARDSPRRRWSSNAARADGGGALISASSSPA